METTTGMGGAFSGLGKALIEQIDQRQTLTAIEHWVHNCGPDEGVIVRTRNGSEYALRPYGDGKIAIARANSEGAFLRWLDAGDKLGDPGLGQGLVTNAYITSCVVSWRPVKETRGSESK